MAPEPVTAPPAQPPRYGLLVAAALPDVGQFRPALSWEPETCNGGESGPADCNPLTRDVTPTTPGTVVANPITLWAIDACSTLGIYGRDWQGRARRQLEATQSAQLAEEVWAGAITQATQPSGEETPYLADEETLVLEDGDQLPPDEALALLEYAASRCSGGRRVMLHMTTHVLDWMLGKGSTAIRADGNQLVTALGNLVVPDAGYPGTGPDATGGSGGSDVGNHWLYASSIIQVRLDAIEVRPPTMTDAQDLAVMVDRPHNNALVIAQRLASYQLDPCCRFAVQTDLPIPTIPS